MYYVIVFGFMYYGLYYFVSVLQIYYNLFIIWIGLCHDDYIQVFNKYFILLFLFSWNA